jgi:hypothetical protein
LACLSLDHRTRSRGAGKGFDVYRTRAAELRKLIETQNAGLPQPLWPGLLEGAIRIDVPLNAVWKKDQEYVYWAN